MSTIYLLCGCPASGKSTWAKNFKEVNDSTIIISRDEIRFSFLKEGEDYFSHEDEVKKKFFQKINNAIDKYDSIIVDATNINARSRHYTIDHITKKVSIVCIVFVADLDLCLERNENRKDTLAYVPRGQIRRFKAMMTDPAQDGIEYTDIMYKVVE